MDNQPKLKAQSSSEFFKDGAAMRIPPAGTVMRGQLREDDAYWRGLQPGTKEPLQKNPVAITEAGLKRGQERYNIYCTPCHGQVGDGKGIVAGKGFPPLPSFHSDLIRSYPDGQIFRTITDGIRNMPSYKAQITVEDRWLIVNYLRALQRSQHALAGDIPAEERMKLVGR